MPDSRSRARNRPRADADALWETIAPAYEVLASPERIARETEALAAVVLGIGGASILDAGCAAGFHSVALARRGFHVVGIDRSAAMIREARSRAAAASVEVRFLEADLADAPASAGGSAFDAVLCLGNTMAMVASGRERARVLRAFRRALRPGGLLLIQMRDLASIIRTGHVFPTRSLRRGDEEWILLRRQDPAPGGIRFVSTLLHRTDPEGEWETLASEQLRAPLPASGWREAIAGAGFDRIRLARDLRGAPRGRAGGPDLVIFSRAV